MKKSKVIVAICVIVVGGLLAIGIWRLCDIILMSEFRGNRDMIGLRWAILGAMGSWAGSIFGAVALMISILAFWQPQRIIIEVSISTAIMLTQCTDADSLSSYDITVKNVGLRPITVSNVYLNFGGKKHDNIFVGMLNQGSPLQPFTVSFPKRLEPGESFEYYLLRDKLCSALAHYEEKTPLNTPLYICVSEVVKGQQYYKTKWTLSSFIGSMKNG